MEEPGATLASVPGPLCRLAGRCPGRMPRVTEPATRGDVPGSLVKTQLPRQPGPAGSGRPDHGSLPSSPGGQQRVSEAWAGLLSPEAIVRGLPAAALSVSPRGLCSPCPRVGSALCIRLTGTSASHEGPGE